MKTDNIHNDWLEMKGWTKFSERGRALFMPPDEKDGKLYALMSAVTEQIRREVSIKKPPDQ